MLPTKTGVAEGQTVIEASYNGQVKRSSRDRTEQIVPQVTSAARCRSKNQPQPSWEEQIIINQSYNELLKPHTLILFELLDFGPTIPLQNIKAGGGFYRIAWGYLVPVNSKGKCILSLSPRAKNRR